MSTEIQPFEFEGNKVRALADGDEVMFVASDIAKILGYRDAAALTRTLDDEEKGTRPIDTHGGTQTMTVISEPGLYKAILQRQTGRQPIKDINIIGNGPKALADITMVGNNYKMDNGTWTCGKDGQSCPVTCGMPSALVSKLTVGGEN